MFDTGFCLFFRGEGFSLSIRGSFQMGAAYLINVSGLLPTKSLRARPHYPAAEKLTFVPLVLLYSLVNLSSGQA